MWQSSSKCRAKCASVTFNVDCFSNLAVVIFYHVQSLTFSFDRVDSVFVRYFEQSVKNDTRKGQGMGSRFVFTGNTKLPNKVSEDFLINIAKKSDFNGFSAKKFHHLHKEDHSFIYPVFIYSRNINFIIFTIFIKIYKMKSTKIYILSYRDGVLTNHPEQVSSEGVSIRKYQSEEADQRVKCQTLHCVGLLTLKFSFS